MSERDGYRTGVPCWVQTLQPDAERAASFYAELLGWEPEDQMPPGSPQRHLLCRLRGRDVAAIGSPPAGNVPPDWMTYVWVDDVEDVAAKALDAGGSVAREPFEAFDGGLMAVLADQAGAVFGVWRPRAHRGAQLVNEPGAWAMSILETGDVEGSKRFYGAVLGWSTETFDAGDGELTMWRLPGYVGGEPEQPVPRDVVAVMVPATGAGAADDAGAHWGVNFWVHDADAIAAKVTELGGSVVVPPSDRGGFREAVVADPAGAAVSVSQLTAGP